MVGCSRSSTARAAAILSSLLPPMVPAPAYSGTFDASQLPVVEICKWVNGTCTVTVATLSGSAVTVDAAAQAYTANWKTRDSGLERLKTYRIQVLIGTRVLGYADAILTKSGQIRLIENNQFVGVPYGETLPIRFRIETAVPRCTPGTPGCAWANGDLITFDEESWGDDPTQSTAAALLVAQFNNRYPQASWSGTYPASSWLLRRPPRS